VITDAHVVAGEPRVVVLAGGTASRAAVVVFDPTLDVAVLRVPGLSVRAIPLHESVVATGTKGAVIGFPGGGPKTATPAGVAGALVAQGRDIYGGGLANRPIYAVSASVLPGNSGSPLVTGNAAIGMVFSRSLSQSGLAYAIRSSALAPEVARAVGATKAIGSGVCTPG
jgi:S1-C subfamily serine protease